MIRTSCIPGDSHRVGVVPGLFVSLGLALCAGTPAVALAQPVFQPGKSIRLLVGFPPGGSTDLLARNLARLQPHRRQRAAGPGHPLPQLL